MSRNELPLVAHCVHTIGVVATQAIGRLLFRGRCCWGCAGRDRTVQGTAGTGWGPSENPQDQQDMGCTPSIHVSQTGVVYCRESDESNSPRPSSLSATQATAPHGHHFQQTVIASGSAGPSSGRPPTISEAETQTSLSAMKV